jgi:spore germination protein GerM
VRARVALVVGVVVSAAAASGCGLPDDHSPRIITADEAPLDLSQVPSNVATTASQGNEEVEIYLVRDGQLEGVTRSSEDEGVQVAIELLLQGPTENEVRRSLSSSIPSETELNSVTFDGAVAILDLGCQGDAPIDSCGVLGVVGQVQLTIFGQLTCTAMAVRGVDGVRFLQDGAPQGAPTDSGTAPSPEAVTCDDYDSVLRS